MERREPPGEDNKAIEEYLQAVPHGSEGRETWQTHGLRPHPDGQKEAVIVGVT